MCFPPSLALHSCRGPLPVPEADDVKLSFDDFQSNVLGQARDCVLPMKNLS